MKLTTICNGEIDEDPVDTMIWYLDADADGRGDSNSTQLFCLNASHVRHG